MQYKIVVDKQPRTNPSSEKKEYIVDIEELRIKGGTYDSLVITKDEDYVMRRLELTEYHVLNVLEVPIKETLEDINIELFEGDNYIYLVDMTGNKFYAEYMVKNDLTELYATKLELSTSIEQTAKDIMLVVNKKVDEEEFGTLIEQNAEAIKFAWNQISEFIQLMILNNNASFAILDENKKVIMSLDKTGQHFYNENEKAFADMGVQTVDNQDYISFAVPTDYDKSIEDGMAWGVITTSDNKFWPIMYVKNFTMPPKNSGGCTGELVLDGCNLVLGAINSGIITGNVKIHGNAMPGIFFSDTSTEKMLLGIAPGNGVNYDSIYILDNISFYRNSAGSNSFKVGNSSNKYCLFTDEGYINCDDVYARNSIYTPGYLTGVKGIDSEGYVSGKSFINNSKIEVKKNIKKYSKNAIAEIKNTDIYEFNYKIEKDTDKKTIGAIIGDGYNCSKEIIDNNEEGVNTYSMISVAYKAIQEQQEQIEKLQKENQQKDEILANLIERLEKLEKEANNGQD